jgi:hypothetical protein
MECTRDLDSMGPPDTPSVGWRRPLGASVKPLRYAPVGRRTLSDEALDGTRFSLRNGLGQ